MVNTAEAQYVCGLKKEDFQTTIDGKKTDLYILKNAKGNEVAITNYGGAIVAIMVPDRNGNLSNVIQGHDNIQDVINSPEPYLSTLIGRYAIVLQKEDSNSMARNTNLLLTMDLTLFMEERKALMRRYGMQRK